MNKKNATKPAIAANARVLGDWLAQEAKADPNRKFVQCGGPWLTLAELDQQSDRLAAGLQSIGLEKGDRLAIMLQNRIEYVVLVYACAKAGVVQVPINPYLRGEFLRHQLAQSQSRVIVADGLGMQQIAPLVDHLPELRHRVLVGEPTPGEIESHDKLFATLAATAKARAPVELKPSDLCVIMYTSGTTGPSKGCMISHGYYCYIPSAFIDAGWCKKGDIIFGATPMFHFSGQVWLVAMALAAGGSAVVEPSFSATTFMQRAAETGANVLMGMGAMAMAIMARPPSESDKQHVIRQATWVPMTEEKQREFYERFGVQVISEVYGQSECWPSTLGVPGAQRKFASLGRVIPGMQVRLVDEDDNEVPLGEVGEITVRPDGPNMIFQGYWNDAEATAKIFRNLWHHTGDNGRFDEDGFLYFADRKKDSLRRRGENVSSIELEQAVMRHAGVLQAAAHSVPSELTEDEVKICIVRRPDAQIDIKQLFEFFKQSIPYYAIPRYVEFIDALPANINGRVQKFILRERGITPATIDLEALGLVVEKSERRS